MIEDAIRSLFWAIAKLFLSIGDWVYDIIDIVINIDLSNSKVILYTWSFMLIFLTFACFFRIAFVILQKTADDNESLDTSKLMKKIGSVFLTVALSTTFFSFCLVAPGYIVRTYNKVITYDERMTSSTAVISATAKTPVTSSLDEMSSTDEVISIETIDDKLNDEENGEYVYFKGYAELLLCAIGAILVAWLQISLIIDTAIRLFLNIFRFIIGFIPISSLVEDNPTCGDWLKDLISDALMMMFVPISLNMVYGLMSTSTFTLLNGIVRIIIFAIALMAISKTGDMIAKYMGASNLSKGGGKASSMIGIGGMMAIRGAGSVIKGAGKYLPKAASGISKTAKSGAEKVSQVAGNMKDNAIREAAMAGSMGNVGGLGSNNAQNTKKDSYFVNNASQESFKGGSSGQNMEESILDQSPTSHTNDSRSTGAGFTMNGTKGAGPQATSTQGTSTGSSGENQKKNTASGVMNDSIRENMKEKQAPGSKMNRSPVSTGGTAFVDNQASGHLYKSSNSVYKQNLRDEYRRNGNTGKGQTGSTAGKQNGRRNAAVNAYMNNSEEGSDVH